MRRRAGVGAAVLAAAVLAVGCTSRADFDEDRSFADVEQVVEQAGLAICSIHRQPDGVANQATATRTYAIGRSCPSDDVVRLTVDRFDDADARDGAARQFEVLTRPRGDGVVWTWGPLTLFATAQHDDAVMDALAGALDDAGAM
jgi:hypothetical protein